MRLRRSVTLVLALLLAGSALAGERFALPQFKSGYALPTTEVPPARANVLDYVDVAALVLALGAASYLAIRVRSRRGLWWLMLASLAYFGFWRGGCVCPIGAVQNVSQAVFDSTYAIPAAVAAFFLLPLVFTLFFGRTFCAAVCPLGALQDFVAVRPVAVPVWMEHALGLLAYVYLGAAVLFAATGSAYIICEYDPFVSFFRLMPLSRPSAGMAALSGSTNMLLVGAGFLVTGLFLARPYCRWFCPYGALLRLVSRASKWHVAITPDECIQCRLCEGSCPFGAIRKPTRDERRGPRLIERRRLVLLLVAVPLILGVAGWMGSALAEPFSRMNHTVRQADRVRLEESGQVQGTVDLSEAFYATRRPNEELHAEAAAVHRSFVRGGWLFGGWVGLVVGIKLIHLSVRRTRTDFEPDRGTCVACGRCYSYCPMERKRWKAPPGEKKP